MIKLLGASHRFLFQSLQTKFRIPNSLLFIVHLHNSSETLVSDFEQSDPNVEQFDQRGSTKTCSIRISHPWPEWVELMQQLLRKGYFEGIGDLSQKGELDAKDANRIRTACLNFARDRFDLVRYFSRSDIQVIAGSGCPVVDRKVVNSGKRLRAHLGIDEGNACSFCILRGNCERAYVKANEGEGVHTVDVMRFLLTYGLHPITGVVENTLCLNERVMESVRRLLKQMVECVKDMKFDPSIVSFTKCNPSMQENLTHQRQRHIRGSVKEGDSMFSKMQKEEEDQEPPALQKGDWLCEKCNFFNFAKNTRCLQCNENPSKRQLYQGEWECDSCNYINFRRNIACIKCSHRRTRVSYSRDRYAKTTKIIGGLTSHSLLMGKRD